MSASENNQPDTGRAEQLSPERHGKLRFHKAADFSFAANWLYVPVHYKEFAKLSRNFPVLFYPLDTGRVLPCMLLRTGERSAIDHMASWQGGRLPDVLRLYPFGFSKQGQTTRLAVYPEAPHFSGEGKKIITSKGKPTRELYKIIQHLKPVQQAFDDTASIMEELLALKALQPLQLTVTTARGEKKQAVFLVCADKSVLKSRSISLALRTLLYAHQRSCSDLLAQAGVAESIQQASDQKGEKSQTVQDASNLSDKTDQLIKEVCAQFEISLADLQSRKRSGHIKSARTKLAETSQELGCLDELAKRLNRSVATLRSWI